MNWKLKEVNPWDIATHSSNVEIYGKEELDPDFVEDIRLNGVMVPGHCITNDDGHLIALDGHRRKDAACAVGLQSIKVLVLEGKMPYEEQILKILSFNKQRTKTAEQIAREGKASVDAHAIIAEKRMKAGKKCEDDPSPTVGLGSQDNSKRSVAKAAKELGIGRNTLERGIKAVKAIDEAEAKGDKATAEKIRTTLNTKGASPAAKLVEAAKKVIEESEAETAVDHFKVNVDEDFSPAFEQRKDFRKLLASISSLKSEAGELAEGPGGKWIDAQEVEQICDNLRRAIRFGMPYTECGRCKRDKVKRRACQSCKGRGWLCESAYSTQSAEDKAWIANRK